MKENVHSSVMDISEGWKSAETVQCTQNSWVSQPTIMYMQYPCTSLRDSSSQKSMQMSGHISRSTLIGGPCMYD